MLLAPFFIASEHIIDKTSTAHRLCAFTIRISNCFVYVPLDSLQLDFKMSWLAENLPEWLTDEKILYIMMALLVVENWVEIYLSMRQVSDCNGLCMCVCVRASETTRIINPATTKIDYCKRSCCGSLAPSMAQSK